MNTPIEVYLWWIGVLDSLETEGDKIREYFRTPLHTTKN